MDIPEPLQHALADSIASGKFIDTKLWAFSSRSRTTRCVGNPRPIFANGRVLRSLPYFQRVLSGDDDVEDIREGFPDLLESHSEEYGYSSDSDFEVDNDEIEPPEVDKPPAVSEAASLDRGVPPDPGNEKRSDIVHVEKEDSHSETSGVLSASDMESALAELDDISDGPTGLKHLVKTVIIPDVAFLTLRAALQYLYTGDLEFASPGHSQSRRVSGGGGESSQVQVQPSPRSLYRLAAKYDIPGLKILALEEIKRTLDECDVIEGVFSKYTSRFPEVREVQVEHLARSLLSSTEPWKTAALKRKIEFYVSGALPHAQDVLPALYHRLADPMSAPWCVQCPPKTPPRNDFGRPVLKAELTKSLSSGAFLDMVLYAPASRSGSGGQPKFRPLYFCSAVGGECATKILSCVKDISSGHHEALDNAYKCDSDIEDNEASESLDVGKHDVQARSLCESSTASSGVLNTGSWRTWRAIFYYFYTNRIEFGRLSSQPPVSAGDGTLEKVGNGHAQGFQLPPCSPKSVYTLACTIGLISLRGLAFEDFKSKIDSTNITQELLAPFSARHVTIRTLLLRLLDTGLKSQYNEQLFITSLRTSADGQTPHRGAAIGLVFERLIEEGRKVLFPPTKPKLDPTIETVTTGASNTSTSRTKSPPDSASSNGGSGTTKLSSVRESNKSKKSGGRKSKLGKRYHSPPCVCEICKRARKGSDGH